jgi:predicted MPP superfamily phosphohydrolase
MKKDIGVCTPLYPAPALVVTAYDRQGIPGGLMVAWGGVCNSEPPCISVAVAKNRHTLEGIMKRKAFCVNVSSEDVICEADFFGLASGRDVDKFETAGLTPRKGDLVGAPLIEEFPISMECEVVQSIDLGSHFLFVGKVVKTWAVEKCLGRILSVVRAAEPDLVVSTGDLVDDNMEFRDEEIVLLRELDPPLGTYAVTGNHEYHVGVRQAVEFKERAGMRVLRDEPLFVGGLVLVGMDDASARRSGGTNHPEQAILASLLEDRFVVLLKHRPIVEAESAGLFDLQLSGHTHGGQIWPFYWLTRLAHNYRPGLRAISPRKGEAYAAETSRESLIYVSNGAGTWGPPLRFFAPPEVTIFDIVRKKGN